MKNFLSTKSVCSVLSLIFFTFFSSQVLHSAESPKNKLLEWIKSNPWIGLVAKEIRYGPITLKDLDLDKNGRLVIARPGEEISATVKYMVDADKLNSWNLYHILVGIKGQENPACITHSFGIWDRKGKASFTITAPEAKGVYEVSFDYQEGLFCGDAAKAWIDEPAPRATVGIIIVE
jgi:hypothetical protein